MGNLLKVLTCTDLEQGPNFFLDFESEIIFFFVCVCVSHPTLFLPIVDCIIPFPVVVYVEFVACQIVCVNVLSKKKQSLCCES